MTPRGNRIDPKQLWKYLASFVDVNGIAVAASSATVDPSAGITAALATAGDLGTPVTDVVSTGAREAGVALSVRVLVYESATGKKFDDDQGNEIYGRLTGTPGAYTLSFYSLIAGVETAYTFAAATTADISFAYRFSIDDLPTDALVRVDATRVSEEVQSAGGALPTSLTVTATDDIADLPVLPSGPVVLFVNGQAHFETDAAPSFTRSGVDITWNAANAGFSVTTADKVSAMFASNAW